MARSCRCLCQHYSMNETGMIRKHNNNQWRFWLPSKVWLYPRRRRAVELPSLQSNRPPHLHIDRASLIVNQHRDSDDLPGTSTGLGCDYGTFLHSGRVLRHGSPRGLSANLYLPYGGQTPNTHRGFPSFNKVGGRKSRMHISMHIPPTSPSFQSFHEQIPLIHWLLDSGSISGRH